MRNYVDPQVTLIDGTNTDLAFYVWLKSRQHVLKVEDVRGKSFEVTEVLNYVYNGYESKPGITLVAGGTHYELKPGVKFYVDKELVEYEAYRNRIINGLGLQFNNLPQYVFEIDGSALFRDFLYTVNWSGAWAVSNRFLFSTLSDEDVVKEESYPISGEYKNVPEWEEQFSSYMDLIRQTNITDDNRPEMPYSISSAFWWGCNHKTLISVLSAMKIKFPFFYEVYGKKMMKVTGVEESSLKNYIDYSLDQYFLKDWEKGSVHAKGMYLIDTEVDYIILSQFIRQSPSIVAGVWDTIAHDNADEFSHKVIKGSTTCKIRFVASEARTLGTVSNRCCNFAANSGSGTGSWSGFLEDFLQSTNTPDELRKILPCKFHSMTGTLSFCPMYDDTKFRGGDGAESRNCACPLMSCTMNDAETKLKRDKNKLGQLFYNLTEDMMSKGGRKYNHILAMEMMSRLKDPIYDDYSELVSYHLIKDSKGEIYTDTDHILVTLECMYENEGLDVKLYDSDEHHDRADYIINLASKIEGSKIEGEPNSYRKIIIPESKVQEFEDIMKIEMNKITDEVRKKING